MYIIDGIGLGIAHTEESDVSVHFHPTGHCPVHYPLESGIGERVNFRKSTYPSSESKLSPLPSELPQVKVFLLPHSAYRQHMCLQACGQYNMRYRALPRSKSFFLGDPDECGLPTGADAVQCTQYGQLIPDSIKTFTDLVCDFILSTTVNKVTLRYGVTQWIEGRPRPITKFGAPSNDLESH